MMQILWIVIVAVALSARVADAQCTFSTLPAAGKGDPVGAHSKVVVARSVKIQADTNAVGKLANTPEVLAAAKAGADLAVAEANLAAILAEPFENRVHVTALTRLALTLSNPTTERLRVSFDEAGGAHREVEWDPAVSTALTREFRLEPGDWTITVGSEAQAFSQPAGTVMIRARFEPLVPRATGATIDGVYVATAITATPSAPTLITAWPRPRLALMCNPTPVQSMADAQFAANVTTSAADGSVRGLGVAPEIITDTLALLAEIAIDRARAGALDVLRRRLVEPFCVNDATRVTLKRLTLGDSGEVALPRTCELLRSLRLDDVLASGRPLLFALRDDLRFTIAPAVVVKLARGDVHVERVLRGVVSIVNAAIDRGGFDVLQAQLALELVTAVEHAGTAVVAEVQDEFARQIATALGALPAADHATVVAIAGALGAPCAATPCSPGERDAAAKALVATLSKGWRWTDVATRAKVSAVVVAAVRQAAGGDRLRSAIAYGCQARLVVTIVKRCSGGGCTAGDLSALIARPGDYFAKDTELPAALCWANGDYVAPPADIAALQRLVIDGLALVAPVVEGRGRERARAAVRLIAQFATRTAVDEDVDKVTAFADLAVAVIDEDYGTAFGRFLSLVEAVAPPTPQHRVVRKFAQLIGAVASYAVVYRETKDSDPAEAREARKRALSSIIDAMTDRAERSDEKLVSIGSNVGLSYSVRNVDQDSTSDDPWQPAVRVPLGLRIEYLRKRGAGGGAGVGGFVGLQLVDLGQFIRPDEDDELAAVEWADFLSLGAEAGISHAWLGRELNLAVHASYGPSLRHSNSDTTHPQGTGVWTVGVALGYYVPFIDLN